MEDISIGDTIGTEEDSEPIEFTKISEPTLSMTFSVNDSPFAGRDGKYVTSRHIRDRLFKEKQTLATNSPKTRRYKQRLRKFFVLVGLIDNKSRVATANRAEKIKTVRLR